MPKMQESLLEYTKKKTGKKGVQKQLGVAKEVHYS
jgi:hypothetical protein